jgi:C-terminal processing protease CtpA/Prc
MRLILSVFVFVVVTFFAVAVPRAGVHRSVQRQICALVTEKFYRNDQQLSDWSTACSRRVDEISWWWSRARFMREVQWLLDEFEVSHLMVYNPVEDRRLWRGEAVDTGIRSLSIDDRFVVWRVLDKSAAKSVGILAGDEVLEINHEKPRSNWRIQTAGGDFLLQRGDRKIHMLIDPKPLVVDRKPNLIEVAKGVAVLEISSFRSEYFLAESWRELTKDLAKYGKIIVDLRDNSGGNLIAMLRALSPFICTEEQVGLLSHPRKGLPKGPPPADTLDEMVQLQLLEQYREIPLKTFSTYGCFNGPAVVLVDNGTSSVSEIFAHAMMSRPRTKVIGRPTAGDVVLATWYSLTMLGPGYSLSIPEALYLTTSGESLEGSGVWPHRELDYELADALAGKDSWILRALEP